MTFPKAMSAERSAISANNTSIVDRGEFDFRYNARKMIDGRANDQGDNGI